MRKLDGSIGTVGNTCTAGVRVETPAQKRKRLIGEAEEMDTELSFLESQLWDTVREIQDLKPTKKELEDGVQDLIDCYGR
jgi:hypothetical protein